ncbi:serine hydrolase [Hyphococcus flavus]|uniref:Serine hydrolase n=1 Tax=Hyphococcus flavus TaxID=1866326 RepID=A0AAE9ZD18_9PROT|nr:serine hydrolase domain-containing protein [Hyphococcus flavus]WDI30727.1 serine hydrolase [Hyphococcus flavus]
MDINRRTVLGAGAVVSTLATAGAASAKSIINGGNKNLRKAVGVLEDYADQHRAHWGIPGMTVCVVGPDGFEGHVMSGLADVGRKEPVGPDHVFQVGSITKMMTALTLWSQIDEGKLSPDARLTDLMPEIKVKDGDAITLKHLLDHTSGLPRGASPYLDGGLWTNFTPGSKWAYSNLGYKLAGHIAARTDEITYPECVERRLLKPLGMSSSFGALRSSERANYAKGYEMKRMDRPSVLPSDVARAPWVDYDGASGCVGATSADMALFLSYLLQLAGGDGGPVFSNEAAQRFMADPAPAPGWSEEASYGNGIARITADERQYLHHTGGMVSFTSSLHVDPEAGVAAFASGNVHYATGHRPRNITLYACQLINAAINNEDTPEAPELARTVENPDQFAAVFTAENGDAFEVKAGDEELVVHRNGRVSTLQPLSQGLFASDDEEFAATGVQIEVENEKAVRVWVGDREYLVAAEACYATVPGEVMALAGDYRNDDRWSVPIKIYTRGEGLIMVRANSVSKLTRLANGEWAIGDPETSTDSVRFDSVVGGQPQRLTISGDVFYRWAG